jgi:hypothetical protein
VPKFTVHIARSNNGFDLSCENSNKKLEYPLQDFKRINGEKVTDFIPIKTSDFVPYLEYIPRVQPDRTVKYEKGLPNVNFNFMTPDKDKITVSIDATDITAAFNTVKKQIDTAIQYVIDENPADTENKKRIVDTDGESSPGPSDNDNSVTSFSSPIKTKSSFLARKKEISEQKTTPHL